MNRTKHATDGDYWLRRWRFMNCRIRYHGGGCNNGKECEGCMYDMAIDDFRQICKDLAKTRRGIRWMINTGYVDGGT